MRNSLVILTLVSVTFGQTPPRVGTPAYFETLEKKVAQNPENLEARAELLGAYTDFGLNSGLPLENVRLARRRHVLWLIAHHPEAEALAQPHQSVHQFAESPLSPKGGALGDPAGYAEAAALWKQVVAKPDVSLPVILHAVVFFAAEDRALAFALLDRVWPAQHANPQVTRMRAMLNMMEVQAAKQSQASRRAIEETNASRNATLLGSSGEYLLQAGLPSDPETAASVERWLGLAHQLEPDNHEWRDRFGQVLVQHAGRSPDAKERAQFYRAALDLDPSREEGARNMLLLWLTTADFDAGNAAAEEDARQLLKAGDTAGPAWRDSLLHVGHTISGRLALRLGDKAKAKSELAASAVLNGTPVTGAILTLAQDLLDTGERDAVLTYLNLSQKWWPSGKAVIDHNIALVQSEASPKLVPTLPRVMPKRLPSPEQLTPADGATLDANPSHKITVSWKPVAGAYGYLVDWNYRDGETWKFDRASTSGIFSRITSAEIAFPNAAEGRWRVFAMTAPGHEAQRSEASAWRGFHLRK